MCARVEALARVCARRSTRRAVWRARERETCGLACAGARDELSGVRFNLKKTKS